jgi:hypothetical protein
MREIHASAGFFRPHQAGFLPRKFAKIAKHPAVVRLLRFLAAIPSVAFDRQIQPLAFSL